MIPHAPTWPRRCRRYLAPLIVAASVAGLQAGEMPTRLPAAAAEVASLRFGQPTDLPPMYQPQTVGELRALPPVEVAGEQEEYAEQAAWTLQQVEQMALDTHPALAKASAQINALRGKHWQAGLKLNPSVGYMSNEIGDDGTAGKQGAMFQQTFQLGHKRAWRQSVVSQEIAVAQQQWETTRYRVLTDVRLRFQQTLLAQYRVELLDRLVQVGRRTETTMDRLLQAQEARRIDLLQAKVQADKIDLQHRQAQVRLNNSWRTLLTSLGSPQVAPRPLSGNIRELSPSYTWELVRSRLLESSPDLSRAALEIERARVEIRRQRAEGVPDLTSKVRVFQDTATDTLVTGVTLKVPLPIWDYNQGNVSKAQAEYVAAQREYTRLELASEQRLAQVYQQYREALLEVQQYEDLILPASGETLDLIHKAAEAGEATYLEVFTIQRTNFRSHLEYLDALQRLNSAALRVEGLLLEGALEVEGG